MRGFFLVIVAIIFLNLIFGGIATQYVIEFWGTYLKGVPVLVPLIPCIVAGLFLGEVTIPLAVLTWVFSSII
jgi:hypothetical protein